MPLVRQSDAEDLIEHPVNARRVADAIRDNPGKRVRVTLVSGRVVELEPLVYVNKLPTR